MHERIDPEQALALIHAPVDVRAELETLWLLDARLGDIVRATREPLIGEMRLTWWRDALSGLSSRAPPAEPLLCDIALLAEREGLDVNLLAAVAEGWIEVLAPFPLPDETLLAFAASRGGSLFRAAGRILGADQPDMLEAAGRGWSLTDFAFHCSDPDTVRRALWLAVSAFENAFARRWSKSARPLGMIATLAFRDARAGGPPARRGSPARQFTMLRHRLTGR
jgi:phytoene synthase